MSTPSPATAARPRFSPLRRLADALTYPHGVEGFLPLLAPTLSLDDVRARITAVRRPTADSVVLTLAPNAKWRGFRAGQYVRVAVEIDGVLRTRCYSPANSALDTDTIELGIKAHDQGFVSRYLREHARPGMVLTLSQAQGEFALPEARHPSYLFISGGSGITPVMAMLRTLCAQNYTGELTFLHYTRNAEAVAYAAELAQIVGAHPNVRVLRAFTAGTGGELQGRFSPAQLSASVPGYARAQTFVCGPESLMADVRTLWQSQGLAERLHEERFTAPATTATGTAGGELRFVRSERYAPNDGRNLLDQAEAAGLTPESGCRMGICHSCVCRKKSGTVKNLQTGAISSEADEDIQLCISAPVGDVTLDI